MQPRRLFKNLPVFFFLIMIVSFTEGYSASYTIRKGDTLWGIAKKPDVYGDPWLWPLLWEENLELIRDPERILPGRSLEVLENVPKTRAALARRFASRYRPGMQLAAELGKGARPPEGSSSAPRHSAAKKPNAPASKQKDSLSQDTAATAKPAIKKSDEPKATGTKVSALFVFFGWITGAAVVFLIFLGIRFLKARRMVPSLESRVQASQKEEENLGVKKPPPSMEESVFETSKSPPPQPFSPREAASPTDSQLAAPPAPQKEHVPLSTSFIPEAKNQDRFSPTSPAAAGPSLSAVPPPISLPQEDPSKKSTASPPPQSAPAPVSFDPKPAPSPEVKPFIPPNFSTPFPEPAVEKRTEPEEKDTNGSEPKDLS